MAINQAQHSQLVSFIWNIANDVLVHKFERGTYKNIILPMMVLRRLDVLLEDTKEAVMEALQKYSNINELSFIKYFYKPVELESLESLKKQIADIEKDTDGLLNDILGI